MSIPILDAMNSKRRAIVETDSIEMVAVLHDMSEEAIAGGQQFRVSKPMAYQTNGTVCFESVFDSVPEADVRPVSDGFIEQTRRMRGAHTGYYDDHADETDVPLEEVDGTMYPMVDPSEAGAMIEQRLVGSVMVSLNDPDVKCPDDLYLNVVQETKPPGLAKRESEEDDVEEGLRGFPGETPISESDFSDQLYLPDPDRVSEWELRYTSRNLGNGVTTELWLRFQPEGGYAQELPLVSDSSVIPVVSTDLGWGDEDTLHRVPIELAEALAAGEVCEGDETMEAVSEAVKDADLGERTKKYIAAAPDRINQDGAVNWELGSETEEESEAETEPE